MLLLRNRFGAGQKGIKILREPQVLYSWEKARTGTGRVGVGLGKQVWITRKTIWDFYIGLTSKTEI